MDKLLSQLTIDRVISEDQARVVAIEALQSSLPVSSLLLQTEFASIEELSAYQNGSTLTELDIESLVPDAQALTMLPEAICRHHNVLPISVDNQSNTLRVAVNDVANVLVRDAIRREVSTDVDLLFQPSDVTQIKQGLDKCFGSALSIESVLRSLNSTDVTKREDTSGQPVPLVQLVDAILQDAIVHRASDIHLTPEKLYVRIRFRIDGVLQVVSYVHIKYWAALLVRIKVLSDIDIAETRLAQDGHIVRTIYGKQIDFRVASFPVSVGENLVIRVLDSQRGSLKLAQLISCRTTRQTMLNMMAKPSGLLMVCGPTGSGKTTTLYGLLRSLNAHALNIMTLEDPVEYPMANIQQTRVHLGAHFGYADGVRGVLRQDPDVIMVGEVRDEDSCAMTCRAAMTGHLVLTSTHASDCMSAIDRLLELHANRSVVASVLTGIVAQRLIRKLCKHCEQLPVSRQRLCGACGGAGYSGRVAVLECLTVTDEFASLLGTNATAAKLLEQAIADGLVPLHTSAQALIRDGVTTSEEVRRVLGNEASI